MEKRVRMKRYISDPGVELNKARYNHRRWQERRYTYGLVIHRKKNRRSRKRRIVPGIQKKRRRESFSWTSARQRS